MNTQEVEARQSALGRLSRERDYRRRLSEDRDPDIFDGKQLDVLRRYVKDVQSLEQTRETLREIKYTSSKYTYAHIVEGVDRFKQGVISPSVRANPNYQQALRNVFSEINPFSSTVRPLEYEDSDPRDYLGRRNTHAGYDYIISGVKLKSEYSVEMVKGLVKSEKTRIKAKDYTNKVMIGARTTGKNPFDEDTGRLKLKVQENGPECKTRLVAMFQSSKIYIENQFAYPFSKRFFMDWDSYAGKYSDSALNAQLNEVRSRAEYHLSIDYKNFDQSIQPWLIRDVFDQIIKPCFDLTSDMENEFEAVVRWFTTKDYMLSHGDVRIVKGIPSGSRFTQIVGTIANMVMVETYLLSKNNPSVRKFGMGDDNLIYTNHEIDRDDLANYLVYNFNAVIEPSKCSWGTRRDDPEFLSRTWTINGADRKWYLLVTKLLYPESFRDYVGTTIEERKLKPEDIFYAYVLTFPIGMKRSFNVDKFLSDYFGSTLVRGSITVTGSQRAAAVERAVRSASSAA